MPSTSTAPLSLVEALADVQASPSGPQVAAFFDFDGTVIDGLSAVDWYRHRFRNREIGPLEAARTLTLGLRGVTTEQDFARFIELGFAAWAGRAEDEMEELGERLFARQIAGRVFPEAWQLVRAHERRGHTVVLASSASHFQVAPAARALGIPHVLCTPLEITDGLLTGRPGGPALWREGKAQAVRAFATDHDVSLPESFAYSNGDEDVPFLSAVGRPRAVNPGSGLRAHARRSRWPVLSFASRGRPGVGQALRTAAAYGGILTAMGTGLALGLLNRDQRVGVDTVSSLMGDLGLGLAGVRVDVAGEEHLWAHRPAVFVFNHQSQLDVPVLCRLLRREFTGVAKAQLATDPVFGLVFRAAGVAFVARDGSDPRAALAPAVETLRSGVSVVIAPEGTRSVTPALGPFKKGAFHLAIEAGVPVVPIVIRNAGELMWRDAATIRSGTVDVVVHPAIPTGPDSDAAALTRQVHQLFLNTLADWPTAGSSR